MRLALCAFVFATLLASCTKKKDNISQFHDLVENLMHDSAHRYLKTLRPTFQDLTLIFKTDSDAQIVFEYAETMWADIDKMPDSMLKPDTDDADYQIIRETIAELKLKKTPDFSEEYLLLKKKLKKGQVIYGIRYVGSNGSIQKSRTAFFKAGEKWIFIPLPYKAFM